MYQQIQTNITFDYFILWSLWYSAAPSSDTANCVEFVTAARRHFGGLSSTDVRVHNATQKKHLWGARSSMCVFVGYSFFLTICIWHKGAAAAAFRHSVTTPRIDCNVMFSVTMSHRYLYLKSTWSHFSLFRARLIVVVRRPATDLFTPFFSMLVGWLV